MCAPPSAAGAEPCAQLLGAPPPGALVGSGRWVGGSEERTVSRALGHPAPAAPRPSPARRKVCTKHRNLKSLQEKQAQCGAGASHAPRWHWGSSPVPALLSGACLVTACGCRHPSAVTGLNGGPRCRPGGALRLGLLSKPD